jgi:excinuclease ABC subunit A
MSDVISIRGAREHNLKNLSVDIPKNKLVVLTGPSGSGKSTLAMETLQHECQRQYMESLGMAHDTFRKPKVDAVTGLCPAISVGQHAANRNPRSTVGTATDIHTYLRFIYACVGERPCPACGVRFTPPPGPHRAIPAEADEDDAAPGTIRCPNCDAEMPNLTPAHFSFNKPEGACACCNGLGTSAALNTGKLFRPELSLRQGGVTSLFDAMIKYSINILQAAAKHYGFEFDPDLPLGEYNEIQRDLLYYGVESEAFARHFPGVKPPKSVNGGKFEGVITSMWRRYREVADPSETLNLGEYFEQRTCPDCGGTRLKKEAAAVTVGGMSIAELSSRPLDEAAEWIRRVRRDLSGRDAEWIEPVLAGAEVRIGRMIDAGLGYLSLDRRTMTLSGGEAQRMRLAMLLGSGLTGVLYVLDEPSTGLHPRDTEGLIRVLKHLRDLGNTVLVIEHDPEIIRAADHVIDIGPGAGVHGGRVVATGTPEAIMRHPGSATGAYLREREHAPAPDRRKGSGRKLVIRDAVLHNLKTITASFPLGCFTAVTGVSGSGKSTLIFDILAAAGTGRDAQAYAAPEGCAGIDGLEHVSELVTVGQYPIARMQRSNVATFTDVFTAVRNLFADLPEAKERGLTAKHFSFNADGGRCEHCQGLGVVSAEMPFLPGLEVRCPICRGRRFKEAVLEVKLEGRSISDLLDMTIEESLPLLGGHDKIAPAIRTLCDVGLGYLRWGQPVSTLSGGEAQRLRLAKALDRKYRKPALYLLDEPTTGLHPGDVKKLLVLLHRLVDAGHTVIAIEHNPDLIREADWVVDLGPGGGEAGGRIIAEGTPEQVAEAEGSHTGKVLKAMQAAGTSAGGARG